MERDSATEEEISAAANALYSTALSQLDDLKGRLENVIEVEKQLSPVNKVFVKLSTRSPKDSKKALVKAKREYYRRLQLRTTNDSHLVSDHDAMEYNYRWRVLSEEMANACAVSNASEALELLLDSDRVYEDLDFALKGRGGKGSKQDGDSLDERIDLVARCWDPRLKPESEFRGICQNGKLTCLCQYFHPLYFPDLEHQKEVIQNDIMGLMNQPEVVAAIHSVGSNCIIDFAWLGPRDVMIIELNPFDGVCLGVFPASTGLFLWDDPSDRAIMKGEAPFEFRSRTNTLPRHALLSQCSKDWSDIIYNTRVV